MSRDAAIATMRFGLGARPGELAEAARDPRGWLFGQLDGVPAAPQELNDAAPDAAAGLETTFLQQRTRPEPNPVQQAYRAFGAALAAHLTATDKPFFERWALFWANHLTVSLRGGNTGALIGDYFLRAIRANCLGNYAALLLASARHPAMLRYLDNAQSMGPASLLGQRSGRGLNENYARELLELHTIAPANYSQADVTQLARLLTGWSAGNPGPSPFVFRRAMHEPGEKQVLGRTWPEGEAAGGAMLQFLATHPATYTHLATKLARHFVADDPPPAAIAAIEKRLADTGGDLREAAKAVVALPEAWSKALGKLRTPQEFVIAARRALPDPQPAPQQLGAFGALGQPLFVALAPNGWPDRAENYAGPEAILRRVEWAGGLVRRIPDPPDPRLVLDGTLGPLADPTLRGFVTNAETARDALVMLLGSPAFQRR